uniref:Uncharacterized protein n=1 Tax=Anguilla anguilla TaxID=7936 RepID=A0A0E9WXU0_ANGAN
MHCLKHVVQVSFLKGTCVPSLYKRYCLLPLRVLDLFRLLMWAVQVRALTWAGSHVALRSSFSPLCVKM